MPPAKVVFFSFNYPPLDGGVARLCAALVAGLAQRGRLAWVLTQQRPPTGSEAPAVAERRVTARRPWRELAALRELRRLPADAIVICGVWYPEGLLAVLARRPPAAILAHGLELRPTRQRWRRAAWHRLLAWVLRRARVVVANSGYTAELARERAPGAVVAALPLGVDPERFRPCDPAAARRRLGIAAERRVILSVSRLEPHKGHRLVLEALATLPEEHRAALVYLVAGQGRDMKPLQQAAEARGLGPTVRWLGYVPDAQLPELYCSADLFVLCTRERPDDPDVEGFGLAFLEAQACGIPVVGTRTGGIADAVVPGAGGWLIEQDDGAALAELLARLVEDRAAFREMGRKGRQRVERECSWQRYIERFAATLRASGVMFD